MRSLLFILLGHAAVSVCVGKTVGVGNSADLQAALSAAAPGDVIVLNNGNWTDTTIVLDRSGTEGKPITVKAETPGGVTLTGNSHLQFNGSWLVVEGLKFQHLSGNRPFVLFDRDSAHCRFTESAILDSTNSAPRWVQLQGVSNRIDHCRFSHMNHQGIQLQVETERERPNYHRIDHNIFSHRARGRGNGFETIRIGYSHQQRNHARTTVERNLFYKCDGENEIISNKSTDNRIIGNTFLESQGELTLRHGDKAWVEGNWFLGNDVRGSGGVRIIGSDNVVVNNYFSNLRTYAILIRKGVDTTDVRSYTQVKNALVAFNTIVDCPRSFVIGSGGGTLIPTDSVIANNIIYYPSGDLIEYAATPTNFVYQGNIAMCASLGITNTAGFRFADPKLVKDEAGIYRPAPDSPADNAAAGDYPQITHDISGNARSGTQDAGAQVISPQARVAAPLTEKDVGPAWMAATSQSSN